MDPLLTSSSQHTVNLNPSTFLMKTDKKMSSVTHNNATKRSAKANGLTPQSHGNLDNIRGSSGTENILGGGTQEQANRRIYYGTIRTEGDEPWLKKNVGRGGARDGG